MSTVLLNALIAIIAALLGALVNFLISRRRPDATKYKEIIAKSVSGKLEAFSVPANTSDRVINDYVINSIKLESDIAEQIKSMEKSIRNFQVHHGKIVDLIAAHEGEKIAIEVKSSLENFHIRSIDRYMSEEDGIKKLLIVSSQPAPSRLLEATKDLVSSGKVSILKIDPTLPSDQQVLSNAVQDALHLPQA
ncbi:MAG: hypothetical protein ABN502_13895 [Gammaproteobacteria bacterium]